MNITEDYVSFEVAKLLEEKGFDEKCRNSYNLEGKFYVHTQRHYPVTTIGYVAPTLQMAMKWLREVHKLSIEPYSIAIDKKCVGYAYSICSCDNGIEMFAERWDGKNPFTTYEQAVEAALKYSLENLI